MATRKNASGSGSSLLTLGLLAVGGYFAYEWFFATPAAGQANTVLPADAMPVGLNSTSVTAGQSVKLPDGSTVTISTAGSYWLYYSPTTGAFYLNVVAPTSAQVAAAAAFENTAAGQSFENKYYPRSGGNSTPPASPAPPAGSGTPSTPATTPSGQTLDAIYKKIIATASADPNFTGSGSSLTGLPDHFNVYLGLAAPGLTVPISVFSDPNTPITAAAYWALMAPALQGANTGLSGLGCYGGVGAYMRGLGAYQW